MHNDRRRGKIIHLVPARLRRGPFKPRHRRCNNMQENAPTTRKTGQHSHFTTIAREPVGHCCTGKTTLRPFQTGQTRCRRMEGVAVLCEARLQHRQSGWGRVLVRPDIPDRAGIAAGHTTCVRRPFALHVAALGEIFKNHQNNKEQHAWKCFVLTETLLARLPAQRFPGI